MRNAVIANPLALYDASFAAQTFEDVEPVTGNPSVAGEAIGGNDAELAQNLPDSGATAKVPLIECFQEYLDDNQNEVGKVNPMERIRKRGNRYHIPKCGIYSIWGNLFVD